MPDGPLVGLEWATHTHLVAGRCAGGTIPKKYQTKYKIFLIISFVPVTDCHIAVKAHGHTRTCFIGFKLHLYKGEFWESGLG